MKMKILANRKIVVVSYMVLFAAIAWLGWTNWNLASELDQVMCFIHTDNSMHRLVREIETAQASIGEGRLFYFETPAICEYSPEDFEIKLEKPVREELCSAYCGQEQVPCVLLWYNNKAKGFRVAKCVNIPPQLAEKISINSKIVDTLEGRATKVLP